MATFVPQPTFGDTGFVAPLEADILAGTSSDINSAFGGALNLTTATGGATNATPQGQLAASETAILGFINALFLFYTNQVDPAYASGRMQDAIARIYFIERNPSQPTVAECLCIGAVGTVIPVGQPALASDGNTYIATESGTIPSSGNITLPFACNQVGPIVCPANSVTQIARALPGFDTITNPSPGVLGNNVETRAAFEARRGLSVAHNSIGAIPSILGAVLTVPNVIDAFVTENASSSAVQIGGYTLLANSIYVAVLGGDTNAVARAIWSRKAPGCGYNGNTTVTVLDQNSGYAPPYPAYQVSYVIPTPITTLFNVVIFNTAQVPSNAVALIQNAIIGAFAGLDGGSRARIGMELLASRYYAPIASLGSWAQIVSLEIGNINTPAATFVGTISGTTLTVMSAPSGTLAVGQNVMDAGSSILDGTQIVALGTGTGGAGTYVLNASQNVASETMYTVTANQFKAPVHINQVATVSATDITVSLG